MTEIDRQYIIDEIQKYNLNTFRFMISLCTPTAHSEDDQPSVSNNHTSRSIVLAQPRAPYGCHIMGLPPVSIPAARLLYADPSLSISIQDGNCAPLQTEHTDIIGLNVLGVPNFPEVLHIIEQLRSDQKIVLGGQVMRFITDDVRRRIFGATVLDGNDDVCVAREIGCSALPSPEGISLVSAYARFSDTELCTYLTETDVQSGRIVPREIAFYVSQGCKYACDFCGAAKKQKERYRSLSGMKNDLEFLIEKSQSFGIHRIEMYLSNLDLFQTPKQLGDFAKMLVKLLHEFPGFSFGMRGLSTTGTFVQCCRQHPDIVQAMHDAGLTTIGFGIDGTPPAWNRAHKFQNTEDNTLLAMQYCREYRFTPEVLMLVGQPKETEEELAVSLDTTKRLIDEYGAVSRPHCYKPIPGSEEWKDFVRSQLFERILDCRDAWTALDVLAAPSPVSHPDESQRLVVARYFQHFVDLPENRTQWVRPLGWWQTQEERDQAIKMNSLVCDR